MRLWSWFWSRPWWLRALLGLPVALAGLAALYVVARALQYSSAEGDAGLFAPSRANVVLRARGLEDHWKRIRKTAAWRAIDRKILRDPALRPALNGMLGEWGLPSLDDLEDVRGGRGGWDDLLFRAAGRDAMLALRVGDAWKRVPWCAATRLRLGDYLLVPFASWVLPVEKVGGYPCLKIRQGGMDLLVSIQGSVAVAGSDRAFLAEALRGCGGRAAPERPLALRVRFEDSRALAELRREIGEDGLFPFARVEPARGLEMTADIAGSSVLVEAVLEGAEPARPEPPPEALTALSPAYGSGFLLSSAGLREIHAWLKGLAAAGVSRDLREAVKTMEDAGFATTLLPLVDPGLAVLLGSEEREGRLYPSVALVMPSRDPAAALEAMNAVMQKCMPAETRAESRRRRVGDFEMVSWRWPAGIVLGPVPLNDVFRPCYAALPDAVVLGNNETFVEAVIDRVSGKTRGLLEQGIHQKALESLRALRMPADPAPAGAFLYPPALRESVDGLLGGIAALSVYSAQDAPRRRAEITAELRRQGRSAPAEEIDRLCMEDERRRKKEQEDLLGRRLRVLDAFEWISVQAVPVEKGLSVRAAAELR